MKHRLVLLLAIVLAGLALNQSPRTSAAPLNSVADSQALRTASVSLRHHKPQAVLRWLQRQSAVSHAARGRSRGSVAIYFRDGTRGYILPSWSKSTKISIQGAHLRLHLRPLSRSHGPAPRALVLEPFAIELGLGATAGDPEVKQLQAAGFQVDQLYDTAVKVSTMATLSQYNVVYMHTHSDPFGSGDGVVATGQLATDDASVAAQLQNGTVVKVTVSGSSDEYYAITSSYIKTYEGLFPGNSLVFLNGCGLLTAPIFYQALASKGVAVMVSWDREATSQDNYLSAAAFFAEMGQGLNVSAAISAEQAAGYGKSTVNGQPATLGYLGKGSITLRDAANPPPKPTPTPTSRPTSTPTSIASPTPTSTFIPVSGPAVTLQIKPKVKPGSKQVVWVKSAPGTVLHFVVAFPNGDQEILKSVTDPSGLARVVFRQHASEIAYGHYYATVTVTAIKGQGVTTKSAEYRIRWALVDVAVEPRSEKVGQKLTIYVHTRPHKRVVVALRFPTKKILKMHARTGPKGWLRIHYTLKRFRNYKANDAVSVRARILHPAKLTATSFRVL
jgi:hypothetical protein